MLFCNALLMGIREWENKISFGNHESSEAEVSVLKESVIFYFLLNDFHTSD